MTQQDPTPETTNVDPKTLVVDVNVRRDAKLDKSFLGSIRQHGVIVPVIARLDETGQLRVIAGQRRTLAAVEANLATIPVRVLEGLDVDEARIMTQVIENDQRAGLDESDRAAAYEQLAAHGLSAATIAKKMNTRKATVETALKVQADAAASKALAEHALTLDQAAVIEEFSADELAVARLVKAAKDGSFEHAAQSERDDRAEAEAVAAVAAELTEKDVTVIDQSTVIEDEACMELRRLYSADDEPITPTQHGDCPGHAAYVAYYRWTSSTEVRWICTDWKANGHSERYGDGGGSGRPNGPMSEEEKQQRREVIANNKAWDSAAEVRRAWLRTFLSRKTAPKDAAQYVARTIVGDSRTVGGAIAQNNQLLAEMLGHESPSAWGPSPLLDMIAKATPGRAQVLTLGVVLAGIESSLDRWSWRNPDQGNADYLNALAAWGYELADVERIITEHQAD